MSLDLSHQYKKFHLGCGTIFIKDYLNIGWWTHLGKGSLYANPNGAEGTILLNHDLSEGIPAANDSLEVVYHSHMLEHLSRAEGVAFAAECFRVLKPGGIMRVLVPDLGLWCQNYVHNNNFFFDEYRRGALSDDKESYPTNGAIFMGMLHNHEHKMGYDYDTLKFLLLRSGFDRLRRTTVQDSDLPEIVTIEPYSWLKALESLCVECYKPN